MAGAGYSLGSSLSFLLALNLGGIVGAILGGWLGDRLNLVKVMVVFFAVAALSISLLEMNSPMPVLYLLIFVAGATTIGTQILLYATAVQLYGLSICSTGLLGRWHRPQQRYRRAVAGWRGDGHRAATAVELHRLRHSGSHCRLGHDGVRDQRASWRGLRSLQRACHSQDPATRPSLSLPSAMPEQ